MILENIDITHHAEKKYKERSTFEGNMISLLEQSKSASVTIYNFIRKNCPNHMKELRAESDYVYFVQKDRNKKLWRIIVALIQGKNKYKVITYFEIEYNRYYP